MQRIDIEAELHAKVERLSTVVREELGRDTAAQGPSPVDELAEQVMGVSTAEWRDWVRATIAFVVLADAERARVAASGKLSAVEQNAKHGTLAFGNVLLSKLLRRTEGLDTGLILEWLRGRFSLQSSPRFLCGEEAVVARVIFLGVEHLGEEQRELLERLVAEECDHPNVVLGHVSRLAEYLNPGAIFPPEFRQRQPWRLQLEMEIQRAGEIETAIWRELIGLGKVKQSGKPSARLLENVQRLIAPAEQRVIPVICKCFEMLETPRAKSSSWEKSDECWPGPYGEGVLRQWTWILAAYPSASTLNAVRCGERVARRKVAGGMLSRRWANVCAKALSEIEKHLR